MGQQPKHIDLAEPLLPMSRYVGQTFRLNQCTHCGREPYLVLESAEYETADDRLVNAGLFRRAQIYCPKSGCRHDVFTPIEASTPEIAANGWNQQVKGPAVMVPVHTAHPKKYFR